MSSSIYSPQVTSSTHHSCKQAFLDTSDLARYSAPGLNLGKALFFAIKQQDFEQAARLIQLGAPLDGCYEIDKDVYRTTTSVLVTVICQARISQGHKAISYKVPDRLLDEFLQIGVDIQCRCSSKFEHRCPLYLALKTLKVVNEQDLFKEKNVLVQKLILNGANIKEHIKPHKTFASLPYFDIEGIRSYLLSRMEVQQLPSTSTQHFHVNHGNPLPTQHHSQFSTSGYQFSFKYK